MITHCVWLISVTPGWLDAFCAQQYLRRISYLRCSFADPHFPLIKNDPDPACVTTLLGKKKKSICTHIKHWSQNIRSQHAKEMLVAFELDRCYKTEVLCRGLNLIISSENWRFAFCGQIPDVDVMCHDIIRHVEVLKAVIEHTGHSKPKDHNTWLSLECHAPCSVLLYGAAL